MQYDFSFDKTQIKIFKLGKEPKPKEYWLTQSPEKRIAAIEFLRQQHAPAQQRLQRVYRIIKRTPG